MTLLSILEKPVVVDASVILKWHFNDEECVSQATALLNDFYLHGIFHILAPNLLTYELANTIVVAARRKRISTDKVVEAMDNLLKLGIELREVDSFDLLDTALRYAITAYDAANVALASSEKCDLWTGDKALYQAVSPEMPSVKWIGDYPV